jgi:antitoxin component of MazEF toxin-antitoxin module
MKLWRIGAAIFRGTLSRSCQMEGTITVQRIDGELGVVFPDETIERLQLAEGDTFRVTTEEKGILLIPIAPVSERVREAYRRGADKYRNALRQMADDE